MIVKVYILHKLFITSVQEVEQLRQEKLEIDQKLRTMHPGNTIGSTMSYQNRRNDRYIQIMHIYSFVNSANMKAPPYKCESINSKFSFYLSFGLWYLKCFTTYAYYIFKITLLFSILNSLSVLFIGRMHATLLKEVNL